MDLVDGGNALRGEPYARSLDEGEGYDGPIDALATHDGSIDLRRIGLLTDKDLGLQVTLEHRAIGGVGLEGSEAGIHARLLAGLGAWRIIIGVTDITQETTAGEQART